MDGTYAPGAEVRGGWWSEGGCCQGSAVRVNVPWCDIWCCCGCCCCCCCNWWCDGWWLLMMLLLLVLLVSPTVGVTRGSVEPTVEIFRTVCDNFPADYSAAYWFIIKMIDYNKFNGKHYLTLPAIFLINISTQQLVDENLNLDLCLLHVTSIQDQNKLPNLLVTFYYTATPPLLNDPINKSVCTVMKIKTNHYKLSKIQYNL